MSRVVGVLGGMGPAATIDFQRRILTATPAKDDADHLRVVTDNDPRVPSRIAHLIEGGGESPAPALAAMARGLEAIGADLLAMPCNTAHHFLPAIRDAVTIPVLDMVALSSDALAALDPAPRRVGMLASPAIARTRLYDTPLASRGIVAVHADGPEATELLAVIRAVKAGAGDAMLGERYGAVARALAARSDALLVACTEFSTLPLPALGLPTLDALDILARATVRAAQA